MQSIKRSLCLGVTICALVFAGAKCWGNLATRTDAGAVAGQSQDNKQQEPAKSTTYTGTIVRDGEQFLLRDSSGQIYKLDDSERAKAFEGKAVRVTGKLDTDAKLIHVENIEGVDA